MNDDEPNLRAVIGANQPPPDDPFDPETIRRKLDELTPDLRGRVSDLEAASEPSRLKPPKDDKSAGIVMHYVDLCTKAIAEAKRLHKIEKEPYLSGGRCVDQFFAALIERTTSARDKAQVLCDTYAKRKRDEEKRRAEERTAAYVRQGFTPPPDPELRGRMRGAYGTSMVVTERASFEITDIGVVPLEALRSFFDRDAVEKALRAYLRHHTKMEPDPSKIPPLAGVRFFTAEKAKVSGR